MLHQTIRCPGCKVQIRIPQSEVARTVQCSRCDESIRVPAVKQVVVDEDDDAPALAKEPVAVDEDDAPAPAKKLVVVEEDEDDDDAPAQKSARPSRKTDRVSAESRRRSRDNDDDEEEDEDDDAPASRHSTPYIIAAIVMLVGTTALCLGAYFAFRDSDPKVAAPEPAAEQPPSETQQPPPSDPAKPDAATATPTIATPTTATPPSATPTASTDAPAPPTPEQAIQRVKASTVYIKSTFGLKGAGSGSGFFTGPKGCIVTNAHVIGYGGGAPQPATAVDVTIDSGEKTERTLPAFIYGYNQQADLALLMVDAPNLPAPLAFGKAANLVETEQVFAFGFPYGEFLGKNITVTRTDVTSLRKNGDRITVIQLGGGLQPGNSGGPVANKKGEVVGVSVAKLKQTDSIAFAIPAEIADEFVREQLRSGAKPQTQAAGAGPGASPSPAPKIPTEPWKPIRVRPAAPVAFTPAKMTADSAVLELDPPATDTCVGGAGRYILLNQSKAKRLAVFDATQAALAGTIPLTAENALFAAGAEYVIVVYPETRSIERWSLKTLKREAAGTLPTLKGLEPIAIAMGSASNGPLLVQAVDYPALGERFFFDVEKMTLLPGSRTTTGRLGALPGNVLRAAPDGTTFTVFSPLQKKATFLVVADSSCKEAFCPWPALMPPTPADDGFLVFGAGELADRDGKLVEQAPAGTFLWHLPATHGPLYLSLAPRDVNEAAGVAVSIHTPGQAAPLFTLLEIESIDALGEGLPQNWRFDGKVFFVPGAHLLAVLSPKGDQLHMHRINLDDALARSETDYLFVNSHPPASVRGKHYEYKLAVKSKKKDLQFNLVEGAAGMTVSPAGVVTWDVPNGFNTTVLVKLIIADGVQNQLHEFEIVPAGP